MKITINALALVSAMASTVTATWEATAFVEPLSTGITNSNPNFGMSVAIAPDFLIVGASHESTGYGGSKSGSVYAYSRPNHKTLDLLDDFAGSVTDERFGQSVDISSDSKRFIVGAPRGVMDVTNASIERSGLARVYQLGRDKDEGVMLWKPLGKDLKGLSDGEEFGKAVAISDDGRVICVGAGSGDPSEDIGRMSIYFWNDSVNNADGGIWELLEDTSENTAFGGKYGEALDIVQRGDRNEYYIAVGAPGDNDFRGKVEVFQLKIPIGKKLTEMKKVGSDIKGLEEKVDQLGKAISMGIKDSILYVAIGVPGADIRQSPLDTSGHVDIYRADISKNFPGWDKIQTIQKLDNHDETGLSLALSRDGMRLVVGSHGYDSFRGAVRVYDYNKGNDSFETVGENLLLGEGDNHGFGKAVALSGLNLVISSPFNQGQNVKMFRYNGYTIYDGGDAEKGKKKKSGLSGFVKFLWVLVIIASIASVVYIVGKYALKRGYTLDSITKAMTRSRTQHTPVSTINQDQPAPFRLRSRGARNDNADFGVHSFELRPIT